jgi:SAM-dependent methyltransferase
MMSLDYYTKYADEFYHRTIHRDMSDCYRRFLSFIPSKGKILDAGCGVGRDAKYFRDAGYSVVAFDGCEAMVQMSTQVLGQPTLRLLFQEMDFKEEFDGVWSCAALLHVPYEDTLDVFKKIHGSLKPRGIFYACYKQGQEKMTIGERDFYNMDPTTILPYFQGLFEVIHMWDSPDSTSQVAPSPSKSWFNFLVRKWGN